jgi:hypothetical protein
MAALFEHKDDQLQPAARMNRCVYDQPPSPRSVTSLKARKCAHSHPRAVTIVVLGPSPGAVSEGVVPGRASPRYARQARKLA